MRAPPPSISESPRSVSTLLETHHRQRERLLEVLHELQTVVGFLRREDLRGVAHGLAIPEGRVLGVATFYPHFRLAPPPRHRCTVCIGTACSVSGAATTVEVLAARLTGVPPGQIQSEVVSCVGACGVAPVVLYDGVLAARQSVDHVLTRIALWA